MDVRIYVGMYVSCRYVVCKLSKIGEVKRERNSNILQKYTICAAILSSAPIYYKIGIEKVGEELNSNQTQTAQFRRPKRRAKDLESFVKM